MKIISITILFSNLLLLRITSNCKVCLVYNGFKHLRNFIIVVQVGLIIFSTQLFANIHTGHYSRNAIRNKPHS